MTTLTHKQKVSNFIERNATYKPEWYYTPSNTIGLWRICGEDPNCDMGGSHIQPYLETVSGTLQDAIDYAVELPRFWGWGAGGSIEQVIFKEISSESYKKRIDTEAKIMALEKEIKQLQQTL